MLCFERILEFSSFLFILEFVTSLFRDVYHTKRMQQVLSVLFSMDNKLVLSGSDEMNLRVWKARASEKLAPVSLFLFSPFFTVNHFIFRNLLYQLSNADESP